MEKSFVLTVNDLNAICDISAGTIEVYRGGPAEGVLIMKITVAAKWGMSRYAAFLEDLFDKGLI